MAASGDRGLEVPEDLVFQHRIWVLQRVAWVVLALILAAALLGFFGSGPISSTKVDDPSVPFAVQYDRIARKTASSPLRVHLDPGLASEGIVEIAISRSYIDQVQIRSISPDPQAVTIRAEWMIYSIQIAQADEPVSVVFDLIPQQAGRRSIEIGIGDEVLRLPRQWVLP